jgi:hypothetical protein
MLLLMTLWLFVPEDSNTQYVLDKQIAHYFPEWEVRFDSMTKGLRTSQGCLDVLYWYIDLDTKYEVMLSNLIGLRYRNKYLGDYGVYISDHVFEPFFQVRSDLRLLLSVSTHYYKGEDELGAGWYLGDGYTNYLETFVHVEDFDRNFSLKDMPEGIDKRTYRQHPVRLSTILTRNWTTGRWTSRLELTNRYHLQSTEPGSDSLPYYTEKGLRRALYTRAWQDIGRFRLGGIVDLKHKEQSVLDMGTNASEERLWELYAEPTLGYRINRQWYSTLYLSYNHKTLDDSLHFHETGLDSISLYERDVYAYLIDMTFEPGGRFVWHFGMQRQFYYNNQGKEVADRRLILGFEYRYENVWFYFVEAMEGDFPTPKWLHNHTYVQLMLRF